MVYCWVKTKHPKLAVSFPSLQKIAREVTRAQARATAGGHGAVAGYFVPYMVEDVLGMIATWTFTWSLGEYSGLPMYPSEKQSDGAPPDCFHADGTVSWVAIDERLIAPAIAASEAEGPEDALDYVGRMTT